MAIDAMQPSHSLETLTRRAFLQRAGLSALTLLSAAALPPAQAGTLTQRPRQAVKPLSPAGTMPAASTTPAGCGSTNQVRSA